MRTLVFTITAALALSGCFFSQSDENAFKDGQARRATGSTGGETTGSSGSTSTSTSSGSGSTGRCVRNEDCPNGSFCTGEGQCVMVGGSSNGSGSTGSSSGSGSGTGNVSAGSSGSSGSSGSGSSGALPYHPIDPGGGKWAALGISPAWAASESVALVGGYTASAGLIVQIFDADGGPITDSSPETFTTNGYPRAVVVDDANLAVVEQTGTGLWEGLKWSLGGSLPVLSPPQHFPCNSSSAICGEVMDLAGSPSAPVALSLAQDVNQNSEFILTRTPSTTAWQSCATVAGVPLQVALTTAAEMEVLASVGPSLSRVYAFASDTCAQRATPLATFNVPEQTMMLDGPDGGPTAVVGGAPGDGGYSLFGYSRVSAFNTWPAATPVGMLPSGVTVIAAAVRAGTPNKVAALYLTSGSNPVLHVIRQVNGPAEDIPLPDRTAEPLSAPNFSSPIPTAAGHQIAVTSTGSVFFITRSGAYYWPPP